MHGAGSPASYWERGHAHEDAGRDDEAEATYRAGIAAGHVGLNVALCELLARGAGRESDAETACRAAIDAGFREAWWSLGEVLTDQPGREAEAEQALLAAIDYEGESEPILSLLRRVRQRMQRHDHD